MHHIKNNDPAVRASLTNEQTARLVDLFADQITAALDEAICEIDALSRAFVDTARHASALLGALDDAGGSILADSVALQQAVQKASVRLQFADRLNQRLSNVSENLAGLAGLMQSTDLPISDIEWAGFLEKTRATFTMEHERQMFDAVFGMPAVGGDPAADASSDSTLFDGAVGDDI